MIVPSQQVFLPDRSPGDEYGPILDVRERLENCVEVFRPLAQELQDSLYDLRLR